MIKKIVSVLIIIICLGSFLPEKVDASLYYLETTNYNRSATIYKGKQKKIRIGARIKGEKILKWWVSNSKLKIVKKKKTYCIVKAKKVGTSYVKGKMLCGDGKIRKVKFRIKIKKKKTRNYSSNSQEYYSPNVLNEIANALVNYGYYHSDSTSTYYWNNTYYYSEGLNYCTTAKYYPRSGVISIVLEDGYNTIHYSFRDANSNSCEVSYLNSDFFYTGLGYLYKNKIKSDNACSFYQHNIPKGDRPYVEKLVTVDAKLALKMFNTIMSNCYSPVRYTDLGFYF